ncbi:restriction endonuclease subunit S [Aliarcobacter butzleri]|uniref:restriction endonuclease subunit S n=1 Tax=Aliarcobacter butzleri TaxID=28197 RepID=UPI00215B356D|nr:restriction endonuclease subunit S [Aliarcobacter butzleri]MCR8710025.1 restriction endonuclease subunit S [Aliarcobacter butzleri]
MKYRIREQNELKPSGVEWLGDIPNSWYKSKMSYYYKAGMGQTILKEDLKDNGQIPVYSATAEDKFFGFIDDASILLFKDDLVIPARGNSIGYVKLVKEISTTTQTTIYCKKISKSIYSKFTFYYMKGLKEKLFYFVQTAIPQITVNEVLSNSVLIPSLLEQQKIADFLDEKNKIFDEAISKKEQLISKLELAKQSLISEVVTGKLKIVEQNSKLQTIKREKNELKSSAVEWLGDIPKDWKVKKSKYLFEIRKRIAGTLGFDVLSITQKGIKIKDIETGGGQLSMDYSKYQIVNIGDFAMNHMDLLTGFVDIAKVQGVTSPDYRVFSLIDKNSDSNFYLYLFQMGYKNQIFFAFGQGSSQLGRWRFPTEEFNKFYFPYPSLEEQQKISKYLDEKLIHFDNTIEKTKQSIKKLKEAKEALISQAVTGKIEVL